MNTEEHHIFDEDNTKSEFAKRLRALRMQKGLNQRAFTKLIGLNYTQYNRYENGERLPATEVLSKLADALSVSVDYLLEGNEEDATFANLKDKELLNYFEQVEKFDEKEKSEIKSIIDAYIKRNRLQQLAS